MLAKIFFNLRDVNFYTRGAWIGSGLWWLPSPPSFTGKRLL
jgi:hypothetical protein